MFKHKNNKSEDAVVLEIEKEEAVQPTAAPKELEKKSESTKKPATESDLRDLIEKNLKWSQIIYEQNRKINRKLAWAAAAGWLRVVIIVTPILLALWFLPPIISKMQTTLQGITGNTVSGQPTYSIEQLMQLLPMGDAEKAQLKAILK